MAAVIEQPTAQVPLAASGVAADILARIEDIGIIGLSVQGIITGWNAGAHAIFGYGSREILGPSGILSTAAEDIVGEDFAVLYTARDRALGLPREALDEAALSGRFRGKGPRLRIDGSPFDAEVTIYSIRDESGVLTGFAQVTRDLTAQQAAEQALTESESQLRLLVDSVPDHAIYCLDRIGRVASWNAGAEKIKGYAAAEIIGQDFSVFYTREDRVWDKPQHALAMAAHNGRFQERGMRVRKDGSLFTAEVGIYPIRDGTGTLTGFAKVTRDMTEHEKRAEVEARNLSKSRFLAHLSHEFRTPLNAIIGFSDVIKNERLGPIAIRRYVSYGGDINDSGSHLLELVAAILDLTRVEAGKLVPHHQPIDLDAMVEGVARMIAAKAADRGVALDINVSGELNEFRADPRMLRQCLINLLDNAIKFSLPGGVVRLGICRVADRLFINVVDNGKGMAEADIPLALQPFRQLGEAFTSPMEGVGLGLALVKSFCELHAAGINIRSAPGKGTEVTLAFPYPGPRPAAVAAGVRRRRHEAFGDDPAIQPKPTN